MADNTTVASAPAGMASSVPEDVLILCTNTPIALLHCPKCKKPAYRGRPLSSEHPWAVALYCKCSRQWVVCSLCKNTRLHLLLTKQITFHGWNKHRDLCQPGRSPPRKKSRGNENEEAKEEIMEDEEESPQDGVFNEEINFPLDDDFAMNDDESLSPASLSNITRQTVVRRRQHIGYNSMANAPNVARAASDKKVASLSTSFATDFFGTQRSRDFFQAEHKQRDLGKREIVAKSQFNFTVMAPDVIERDVVYASAIAQFTHSLSKGQRAQFARVLKLTVEKVHGDRKVQGKPDRPWKCFIPTTYQDIRKQYTGYPDSFVNRLPIPDVASLAGSFGCIRLRDCLQNFLAYGYPLSTIPPPQSDDGRVSNIAESEYCRARLREIEKLYPDGPVLVVWMLEWSDGYDPHGFSKANRGSSWIKVVTFVPPPKYYNSVQYTYPVALGSASADHDIVEQWFQEDLQDLCNPQFSNYFYSGLHKEFVRVHLELVASLMDQPERRGALHLTRGNSTYGRRWGYAVDLEKCKDKMVPCSSCSSRLFAGEEDWDATPCLDCAQWDMDKPDNAAKLRWACPEHYPASERPSDGFLSPVKLTFPMLKRALKKAATLISEGVWTKNNVEAYLSTFCINNKMITKVVEQGENIWLLNEADRRRNEQPNDYHNMMEIFAENQSQFAEVQIPPLWDRGVSLHQHIDVIMHLLFLGAVDGTVTFINQWLKAHNKYASFMRVVENRLAGVKKLNLNWCKALLFKGEKLGGWVSENYLAFGRLCKWFYLILDGLGQDGTVFVPPNRPQDKWTADHNRGWLKIRGLDTSGRALELRQRVAGYMAESEPPAVLEPAGTLDDIFDLVESMSDMIRSLMVTSCTESEIRKADMSVKLFLTRFAHLDQKMNKHKKTLQWIASYTFPCLLNLPGIMREFGPLRNFWEGGVRGEGFLPYVKPKHGTIGLKYNWFVNVLLRIIKQKILDNTSETESEINWEEEDNTSDDDDELSYQKREFFKYSNEGTAFRDFAAKLPLSVIVTTCGKVGMVTLTNKVVLIRRMDPTTDIVLRKLQFIHWSTEFVADDGNTKTVSIIPFESIKVAHASLFLPHPNLPNRYYAVRSNWNDDSTEFN